MNIAGFVLLLSAGTILVSCAPVDPVQTVPSAEFGRRAVLETGVWTHRAPPARLEGLRPLLMPDPRPDLHEKPQGEVNVFLVHQGEDLFPCGPETAATIRYSDGDDEVGFCPPAPILASDALKWTGAAVLNGFGVEKNATRCSQNPNVPSKSIAAILDNISYENGTETVRVRARSRYEISGNYDLDLWYTSIRANRKYMRFWSNAVSLSMSDAGVSTGQMIGDGTGAYPTPIAPSCGINNECIIDTTVDLNVPDQDGQGMASNFATGKKAFALLQGVDFDHGGASRQFEDAKVSLSLLDPNVANDGSVPLRIVVKYNGRRKPKAFNSTVYFTIGAYDPDYVAYVNLGSTRDVDWAVTENRQSFVDQVSVGLPGAYPPKGDFTCDSSGCDKAAVLPMFVGLRSWGFDLDDHYQVKSIRALARLNAFEDLPGNNARISVAYSGEANRNRCIVPERSFPANAMTAGAVVCRSVDVCHAAEEVLHVGNIDDGLSQRHSRRLPDQSLLPLAGFLEEQFPYSTRRLLSLNVVDMHRVSQPSQFDRTFLDIKPFENTDCNVGSPGYQAACEAARDTRYRDFLRSKSEIRFYNYEMKGGKTNDVAMYDDILEAAEELGWDKDTQILVVVPNAKIESLGVYFRGRKMAVTSQPYEQFLLTYPVPYQTEWNHIYYIADEVIHEIGHGLGLGHDCEDDLGQPFMCPNSDSVMSYRRDRPRRNDEKWVNQFSECALGFVQDEYLTNVSGGGGNPSEIAGFECN